MKIEANQMESYIGNPVYIIKDDQVQKTMIKEITYTKSVGVVTTERAVIKTSLGEHYAEHVFNSKEDLIKFITDSIE